MNKKIVALTLMLMLQLVFILGFQSIKIAEANFMFPPLQIIEIKSDGSITPNNVPITIVNNVYTFRGNIANYVIDIQCDNIEIDGRGYTLEQNVPAYGSQNGVIIKDRNNVKISNLQVRGFVNGVRIANSTNCNVNNSGFENSNYGLVLADHSTANYCLSNNFTKGGILISYSTGNTLRNNSMNGNGSHFSIECENVESASDFVNDVDESNTIEGKQICYWINQHNRIVPSDAGYVALINCTEITVEKLNIANNGEGILLISTTDSHISNNTLVGNGKGIILHKSESNSLNSNHIINSTYGILAYSHGNNFKNNILENNTYDVNFEDRFIDEFDYSNIVDSAPVCFWSYQNDKTVPTNVGYVVLVGCSNITIQHMNITTRRQAMLLLEVSDSLITRNIVTNNGDGIILKGCSNNKIIGNLITNNSEAICLEASHSNKISGNRITWNTEYGIHVEDSSNNDFSLNYVAHCMTSMTLYRGEKNTVSGNTIIYSKGNSLHIGESINNTITGNNFAWSQGRAIYITGSVGNNRIHHNDFINNMGDTFQVYPGSKTSNFWDDGTEGNFWSDYQRRYPLAKEMFGTNVMDTPVVVNEINTDHFPLANPVDINYQATIVQPANASYESEEVPLVFFVTAPVSWMSYSLDNQQNVTFHDMVILSGLDEGTHKISVYAGESKNDCATETTIFTVTSEKLEHPQNPDIPEFPSLTLLLIIMVALLVVGGIYRRNLNKKNKERFLQ